MKKTRYAFKPYDRMVSSDGVHPNFSGSLVHELAHIFAPKPEAVRQMLLDLRTRWRWTEGFTAAILGVPLVTLRKWQNGQRNPSGAAKKWIWFLHDTLLGSPRKVGNTFDLALWGVCGRMMPVGEPFELAATSTMTTEEFHRQVREILAAQERQKAALADQGNHSDAGSGAEEDAGHSSTVAPSVVTKEEGAEEQEIRTQLNSL